MQPSRPHAQRGPGISSGGGHGSELWGNFPQTYSMVGMINSAMRLSIPWDEAY